MDILRSRRTAMALSLVAFSAVLSASPAAEAAVVRFASPPSVVPIGVDIPLEVEIVRTPQEPASLFSYGIALTFEQTGDSPSVIDIAAAPALDFNGPAGAGAFTAAALGFAGIKGTINTGTDPLVFHEGSNLATFTFRFDQPGTHSFSLEAFNTLGPTEAVFVAGDGSVLDASLTFEGATITAIPEPSTTALTLLASLAALALRRRSPL